MLNSTLHDLSTDNKTIKNVLVFELTDVAFIMLIDVKMPYEQYKFHVSYTDLTFCL